jgi:TonB family protein
MADPEDGLKWWLRYVIVPLIGSGGIVAIFVAINSYRSQTPPVSNPVEHRVPDAPPPDPKNDGGGNSGNGSVPDTGKSASTVASNNSETATTQPIPTPRSVVNEHPPKRIAVSSWVANGLLIQMVKPEYPPIAKAARVSGTVVLQATISTEGTVLNLRVVSGNAMLQSAAMDAVRSWRYRSYLLNNQPIEVDTTINVVFSLDN